MYLVYTNIWLERLLDQERSAEVGQFLYSSQAANTTGRSERRGCYAVVRASQPFLGMSTKTWSRVLTDRR